MAVKHFHAIGITLMLLAFQATAQYGSSSSMSGGSQAMSPNEQMMMMKQMETKMEAYEMKVKKIKEAHGVIMTIAFAILYPVGAALVRLIPYKRQVWVHASVQILAFLLTIVGAGLGIWLGVNLHLLKHAHAVIGLIVFSSLFFQAPLGLIHHYAWKGKHQRTIWAHMHLWLGRTMLILGGINGGLGIQLAAKYGVTPGHWQTVYIVCAIVFFALWFLVAGLAIFKSRNYEARFETGEKLIQRGGVAKSSPLSSSPNSSPRA